MNEKIRKLAEQALKEFAPPEIEFKFQMAPAVQRFAELIVRECAEICLSGKNKENWRCTDSINKGFSDAVLDHFGVEE